MIIIFWQNDNNHDLNSIQERERKQEYSLVVREKKKSFNHDQTKNTKKQKMVNWIQYQFGWYINDALEVGI